MHFIEVFIGSLVGTIVAIACIHPFCHRNSCEVTVCNKCDCGCDCCKNGCGKCDGKCCKDVAVVLAVKTNCF